MILQGCGTICLVKIVNITWGKNGLFKCEKVNERTVYLHKFVQIIHFYQKMYALLHPAAI